MQKRLWGVSAAALALTCLTVTGCGTDGGVSSGSAPATHIKHSATTNATHSSHTNAVTSESVNNTSTSKNQTNNTTTTGNNKTQSQSHSQSSYSTSGMVHLNLTNAQIQTIRTAINKLRGNPSQMTFADGDVKIYVPQQIPQGQQFLKADFGASAIFGGCVNLHFRGFTVTIGGQQPSLLAIHKTNSVKLSNGETGTWYVPNSRPTGTEGLDDFLMTSIGKTYITFYSNLKSVSQAQIEQMAGSMVFLGAHQ
jgi:hypothetical protein